jgi:xanthine dehydrogenase accessory factor
MTSPNLRSEVATRASELEQARVPFVHARVVLAERPTSAKPGDEALVLADGTMEGFVGGTCAESTVRAQAMALLDSKESLLLRITPTPEPSSPGKLTVHNPCLSGGTLEIFLEPVVPAPRLVVVGTSPTANAIIHLSEGLGYVATSWDGSVPPDAEAVVVASHGLGEEEALVAALGAGTPYVGLVASRKRAEAVLAGLGLCTPVTARVRSPAGLDIGARTPEEVALSILAEVVSNRPRPSARALVIDDGTSAATAVDPVCGMTVATVDSSLHLDHEQPDGRVTRAWFCGTGCLRAYAADPSAYPGKP